MIYIEDIERQMDQFIPRIGGEMKYPGKNGKHPRQELAVGKYYLTRYPDVPGSVFVENDESEGMEVPEPVLEMLIRNFWEANSADAE